MRKRYPVVSFDLDKTLIFHTKDTKQAFVLSRLKELGYPATDKKYRAVMSLAREAYDVLGYRYADNMAALRYEYVRFILEGLGCADPPVIQAVAGYFQEYDDNGANFYVPNAARDLLVQAKAAGIRLVALSSNLLALQRIAYCQIEGIFDTVLTPNHGRPKAGLFELLLEQISVSPNECLHIGDDPILDVLAPRGVGISAVLFDPTDNYADFALQARVRSYAELFGWLFLDHNPQPAAVSSE